MRFEKGGGGAWQCKVGTYPTSRDSHSRRIESVELLHQALKRTVLDCMAMRQRAVLSIRDLRVVVEGMMIVGNHPMESLYLEGEMRHLIWAGMERKLDLLEPSGEDGEDGIMEK